MAATETIRVGTLNLRNTDRWWPRSELLAAQMLALRPDAIGLQEIKPLARQADWLVEQVNKGLDPPHYRLLEEPKTGFLMRFWEAIGTMTRLPVVERSRLDLHGGHRVAQRVRLGLPNGAILDFYNTHLHHSAGAGDLRTAQAQRIFEFMDRWPGVPQVLVGDFNADPGEPAIQLLSEKLHSAYLMRHGSEISTSPAPLSSLWGKEERVIDFVFVNDLVEVHDAWRTFDAPDPKNPRLSASDHYGIAAEISVKAGPGPGS
ncbi:MAG: endonuclease/exonuclease/phosphatase family protein [Dehalococcoidia bacterium]